MAWKRCYVSFQLAAFILETFNFLREDVLTGLVDTFDVCLFVISDGKILNRLYPVSYLLRLIELFIIESLMTGGL